MMGSHHGQGQGKAEETDDETAFQQGPCGYGPRVFSKVVERVTARLEARLADDGESAAAASALSSKVDKTWREIYARSLPSAAVAAEQRQKFFQMRLAQRAMRQLAEARQAAATARQEAALAAAASARRLRAMEDRRMAAGGVGPSSSSSSSTVTRFGAPPVSMGSMAQLHKKSKSRFVLKKVAGGPKGGGNSNSSSNSNSKSETSKKRRRSNASGQVSTLEGDAEGSKASRNGNDNGLQQADEREVDTINQDRLECDGDGEPAEIRGAAAGGVGGGGGGDGGGSEGGSGGQEDGGREGRGGDGREEGTDDGDTAAAAAPDVVVTANHVGQFKKGKKSKMWKLEMEGGAVEGHGQVFVFDRCEAQLREAE